MATSHLSASLLLELQVAGRILRALSEFTCISGSTVPVHLRTGLDAMPSVFWCKCHALIFGEEEGMTTAEAWMPWLLCFGLRVV